MQNIRHKIESKYNFGLNHFGCKIYKEIDEKALNIWREEKITTFKII